MPSNSSESYVVKILLGNYIFIFYFLFNWCDNSICLVDAAGSHIQIRQFHQSMATENTRIEGFRGIVVKICLLLYCGHNASVFNRLFFFYFRQIFHFPLDLPLIWVSTVLILMLLILVIYSIIQQRRYVYFIQLIFSVIHSLVHISFPIV